MKIPYRWLKEFVETDLDARAVAERLTNAGIGVEQITPVVEGLSGVVVGEIEAIERDLGVSAGGHRASGSAAARGGSSEGGQDPRRGLGRHPVLGEGIGPERRPQQYPRAARRGPAGRGP